MKQIKRRRFLQATAGAAGSAMLFCNAKTAEKAAGANDRFRIAVAGVHGRGNSHIGAYLKQKNVEVAYLIEPDRRTLERALKKYNKKVDGSYEIKGVEDVRKALEDKDLDAISIATPNHWHSLMTIWGAQAGKHVYVEKPASHDITEGRVAVEAWKKYGVVIQHGTQQRSSAGTAGLTKAVRDGKFGKLKISYGYACKPRGGIGHKEPSDPPDHLNWDLWRGPAVIDRYHGNYVHYNWHWFWVTGNGDLNNQGTHQLDRAQWAIAEDQIHPVRAMAIGGRFKWDDQGETPNTLFGIAQYPNGQYVFFNVRNVKYDGYKRQVQNEYYFEDGGKILSDNKYYAKGAKEGEKVKYDKVDVTPGGTFGSFVKACREGKPEMSNADMAVAHRSCVVGHLMNNSYRIGKKVPFNAKAGTFGDNKDAHEHFMKLHEIMEEGCGVPVDKAEYVVGPWVAFDPKTERFTGEHAAAANKLLKDPCRKGFEVPDPKKV